MKKKKSTKKEKKAAEEEAEKVKAADTTVSVDSKGVAAPKTGAPASSPVVVAPKTGAPVASSPGVAPKTGAAGAAGAAGSPDIVKSGVTGTGDSGTAPKLHGVAGAAEPAQKLPVAGSSGAAPDIVKPVSSGATVVSNAPKPGADIVKTDGGPIPKPGADIAQKTLKPGEGVPLATGETKTVTDETKPLGPSAVTGPATLKETAASTPKLDPTTAAQESPKTELVAETKEGEAKDAAIVVNVVKAVSDVPPAGGPAEKPKKLTKSEKKAVKKEEEISKLLTRAKVLDPSGDGDGVKGKGVTPAEIKELKRIESQLIKAGLTKNNITNRLESHVVPTETPKAGTGKPLTKKQITKQEKIYAETQVKIAELQAKQKPGKPISASNKTKFDALKAQSNEVGGKLESTGAVLPKVAPLVEIPKILTPVEIEKLKKQSEKSVIELRNLDKAIENLPPEKAGEPISEQKRKLLQLRSHHEMNIKDLPGIIEKSNKAQETKAEVEKTLAEKKEKAKAYTETKKTKKAKLLTPEQMIATKTVEKKAVTVISDIDVKLLNPKLSPTKRGELLAEREKQVGIRTQAAEKITTSADIRTELNTAKAKVKKSKKKQDKYAARLKNAAEAKAEVSAPIKEAAGPVSNPLSNKATRKLTKHIEQQTNYINKLGVDLVEAAKFGTPDDEIKIKALIETKQKEINSATEKVTESERSKQIISQTKADLAKAQISLGEHTKNTNKVTEGKRKSVKHTQIVESATKKVGAAPPAIKSETSGTTLTPTPTEGQSKTPQTPQSSEGQSKIPQSKTPQSKTSQSLESSESSEIKTGEQTSTEGSIARRQQKKRRAPTQTELLAASPEMQKEKLEEVKTLRLEQEKNLSTMTKEEKKIYYLTGNAIKAAEITKGETNPDKLTYWQKTKLLAIGLKARSKLSNDEKKELESGKVPHSFSLAAEKIGISVKDLGLGVSDPAAFMGNSSRPLQLIPGKAPSGPPKDLGAAPGVAQSGPTKDLTPSIGLGGQTRGQKGPSRGPPQNLTPSSDLGENPRGQKEPSRGPPQNLTPSSDLGGQTRGQRQPRGPPPGASEKRGGLKNLLQT